MIIKNNIKTGKQQHRKINKKLPIKSGGRFFVFTILLSCLRLFCTAATAEAAISFRTATSAMANMSTTELNFRRSKHFLAKASRLNQGTFSFSNFLPPKPFSNPDGNDANTAARPPTKLLPNFFFSLLKRNI